LFFAKIRNINLRRNVLRNIKIVVPIIRKILEDKGVVVTLRDERKGIDI
jgi:hypothetical protein